MAPRREMTVPVPGIIYVTRMPPSASGVALYAEGFREVLEKVAPTHVLRLPSNPRESQRPSVLARTVRQAAAACLRHRQNVFVVELAGRGLAEFWTAVLLLAGRRRVWLTVHDPPTVCGGAFFFLLLDRHGGRRLADVLSRTLGYRAERWALSRAERVHCLSRQGADALRATYQLNRAVRRLPHVAVLRARRDALRHTVFLPGHIGGLPDVLPALQALAAVADTWHLEVGACDEATADAVLTQAGLLGVRDRVRLLGLLPETELQDAFARAAVVVRFKHDGWARPGSPQHAAVSGPLIHAMAHGCAIITNDTRGAAECLEECCAVRTRSGVDGAADLRKALTAVLADPSNMGERGRRAREHATAEHSPDGLARQLLEDR